MTTSDPDTWDRTKMRALYESNQVAKRLFDVLAGDGRGTALASIFTLGSPDGHTFLFEVTVEEVVKATKCRRGAAIDVLRKFADFGCGRFITGRRGQQSRLKSEYNLLGVARQVVGEVPRVPSAVASSSGGPFVEQPIWLRPGVQVTIRFPQDMTKDEAEKVAGIVRNLWLAPGTNTE